MKRLLLILLAIVLLPILLVGGWFFYEVEAPGGSGKPVNVTIQSGWGTRRIGDELAHDGVVGSSFAFAAYTELAGRGPFGSGQYTLRRHMGASAAAAALEKPAKQHYQKLALPPGLTLAEIAQRVGKLHGMSADTFLALARSDTVRSQFESPTVHSLEGLSWPDTYYVSSSDEEEDVLRRIVAAFDAHAKQLGLVPGRDDKAVVIASLVEKEAKLDSDRPLISAVIWNRLQLGMPLQIDATVLYARGSAHGPITSADFKLPSAYNTYRVKGLPPTPIATVSAASLRAARSPAKVSYLYYVLIGANGQQAFATTYAQQEHNVALARARGLLR
jgi:UPF0755 protein